VHHRLLLPPVRAPGSRFCFRVVELKVYLN
jgi:hypothetical protein